MPLRFTTVQPFASGQQKLGLMLSLARKCTAVDFFDSSTSIPIQAVISEYLRWWERREARRCCIRQEPDGRGRCWWSEEAASPAQPQVRAAIIF